jgi:hypothetical protein
VVAIGAALSATTTTTVATTAAATAVATATAVTTTITATTTVSAATTATGTWGVFSRTSFVARNSTTSDFLLVQSFNRSLRFIRIGHFHESEPTGTTCFPLGNDADLRYLTETAESLSNLFFRRAERKVPYKNIRH